MNKYFFKQLSVCALGVFFANATPIFGQGFGEPADKNVVLGSKKLYEHGHNQDHEGSLKDSREARDSVMVGSEMYYFVMPDKYFNKAYYDGGNYADTHLTKSKFEWVVDAPSYATAITPQNPNTATNTSPYVKIEWGTTRGNADIKIVEKPQIAVCDGAETVIPVTVISKPVIKFVTQTGAGVDPDELIKCVPLADQGGTISVNVEYPILVLTESSQVKIDYKIEFTNLEGTPSAVGPPVLDFPITVKSSSVDVNGITNITGALSLTMTDYGSYKITITKITDRIARKCNTEGEIATGDIDDLDEFTYIVVPQPSAGKTYHVPNNF